MIFSNRLFTCIIDLAGSVVGATPGGMHGSLYFVKYKNDT